MFPTNENNNGFSFYNTVPGLVAVSTNSATYVTALSITGRGIVTSIYQSLLGSAGNGSAALRITIDGSVLIDFANFATYPNVSGGGEVSPSLACMFRFKKSLLIEHSATTSSSHLRISYVLGG